MNLNESVNSTTSKLTLTNSELIKLWRKTSKEPSWTKWLTKYLDNLKELRKDKGE